MDDPELLAAARQIHDESGETGMRENLAELIRAADEAAQEEKRQDAIDQIYELLGRDAQTRRRLDELLPPVPDEPRLGYEDLAGDRQASDDSFDRYACPLGDYAWPVLDVNDPTPPPEVCPHDGTPLAFRAAGS